MDDCCPLCCDEPASVTLPCCSAQLCGSCVRAHHAHGNSLCPFCRKRVSPRLLRELADAASAASALAARPVGTASSASIIPAAPIVVLAPAGSVRLDYLLSWIQTRDERLAEEAHALGFLHGAGVVEADLASAATHRLTEVEALRADIAATTAAARALLGDVTATGAALSALEPLHERLRAADESTPSPGASKPVSMAARTRSRAQRDLRAMFPLEMEDTFSDAGSGGSCTAAGSVVAGGSGAAARSGRECSVGVGDGDITIVLDEASIDSEGLSTTEGGRSKRVPLAAPTAPRAAAHNWRPSTTKASAAAATQSRLERWMLGSGGMACDDDILIIDDGDEDGGPSLTSAAAGGGVR